MPLKGIQSLKTNQEGSLAEQFIGQEFISLPPYFKDTKMYYWIRDKRNAQAEIDYLIQANNQIIPVEVKTGKTGTLKSLHVFITEKKKDKAIRFNTDVPSLTHIKTSINIDKTLKEVKFQLLSLPLYLASEYERLLNEVS